MALGHRLPSWYVRGLRTLADVRNRMDGIVLSNSQALGLKYYSDLQRRMPRSETVEIFERIKSIGKLSMRLLVASTNQESLCYSFSITT